MAKNFFNTTNLSGEQLTEAVKKASNQDAAILTIYMNKRQPLSPSQVFNEIEGAGKKWPLTSVRRSITVLCTKGHLVKLDDKVVGTYGEMEHQWFINERRYPAQKENEGAAEQGSLFLKS